jgi:hypothetical protein
MWRKAFAFAVSFPVCAASQSSAIPGRDLFTFPIGLVAEAPATGGVSGNGMWNPAATELRDGNSWRLAVGSMNAPTDVAVTAQFFAISRLWLGTTYTASMARANVGKLLRTDTDPLTIGDEIQYQTVLLSLEASRRVWSHVVAGIALRSRNGRLDDVSRTSTSVDVGVVADHLTPLDLRFGASTFLLSPSARNRETASLLLGVDARVLGRDTSRTVRAGYSYQRASGLYIEHFVYGSARWEKFEARAGTVETAVYQQTNWRMRFGIVFHHGGYNVGVAREETPNGFAPSYQFTLSSVFP